MLHADSRLEVCAPLPRTLAEVIRGRRACEAEDADAAIARYVVCNKRKMAELQE